MNKKLVAAFLIVLVLIALLVWLFIESTKPLPGEKMMQEGRAHLTEASKVDYNFNPPTSGDHYPSWITKGFFDEPRADGSLVHSLEHGYIIIWYDCERKGLGFRVKGIVKTAYAQTDDKGRMQMTQGSEGSPSAKLSDLPKSFSDGSCDNFKNRLKSLSQKFGLHKLIFIPRLGMDYPLVLTAWGRMEKLNSVDESKIKAFIDAFRDQGPESTVEP